MEFRCVVSSSENSCRKKKPQTCQKVFLLSESIGIKDLSSTDHHLQRAPHRSGVFLNNLIITVVVARRQYRSDVHLETEKQPGQHRGGDTEDQHTAKSK